MNEKPLRRIILNKLGIDVLITIRGYYKSLFSFLEFENGNHIIIGDIQMKLSDYGSLEPDKFARYHAREKAIRKGRIKPRNRINS